MQLYNRATGGSLLTSLYKSVFAYCLQTSESARDEETNQLQTHTSLKEQTLNSRHHLIVKSLQSTRHAQTMHTDLPSHRGGPGDKTTKLVTLTNYPSTFSSHDQCPAKSLLWTIPSKSAGSFLFFISLYENVSFPKQRI